MSIRFDSEGGFTADQTPEEFTPAQREALANLTRRTPTAPRTLKQKYAALRAAGKLTGTIKACLAKREARNQLADSMAANGHAIGKYAGLAIVRARNRSKPTVVPLGSVDILSDVKARNPRLREWSLGQTPTVMDIAVGHAMAKTPVTPETPHGFAMVPIYRGWRIREIGSNSNWNKRSTFQRGVVVQSYATCADFRVAVLHLAGAVHTIPAPRGWRWDIDANWLRLRSCSDARIDYHPTASELTGDIAELPRLAKAGWKTRQEAARAAKAKAKADAAARAADAAAVARAEAVGVMVCLADSIRAGNCRAGSENFARNHGLDPSRHYTPGEVLAVANGQTRLVALACTAALRRTIRELERGYSELAEHRVG